MAGVINVRLNDARILPFLNEKLDLKPRQKVIVDIDGILEFGVVVCGAHQNFEEGREVQNLVLRVATEQDIAQNARLAKFESADKLKVLECARRDNIVFKLVAVKRSFDEKKILVMYTAEDRVDFRNLVRELAKVFKMRVEMRQISDREEARYIGGCGICGQPICCRRFLTQPKQTTIKMAKAQGQALAPNKINGVCGKLMCCLQYEYSQYREVLDRMPLVNSKVLTPEGEGVVVYNDCLSEEIMVKLNENQNYKRFKPEVVKVLHSPEVSEDDR